MSLVWQTAATASPRCLPSSSTRQRSGSAGRRSTDSRWRSATHLGAGTWRGVSPKSLLDGGRLYGATTTAPNRLHPWGRGGSASRSVPARTPWPDRPAFDKAALHDEHPLSLLELYGHEYPRFRSCSVTPCFSGERSARARLPCAFPVRLRLVGRRSRPSESPPCSNTILASRRSARLPSNSQGV